MENSNVHYPLVSILESTNMQIFKSQSSNQRGILHTITSSADDYTGHYTTKPTEDEPTIDIRAKALNNLRFRRNEPLDAYNEPTYRAGHIRGVVMMFPHDELINVDRGEPVLVLTYKDNKLSARANWGSIQIKGDKPSDLVQEAIAKLISKVGRDANDYEYVMGKFRGTRYVLVKGW